MLTYLFMPHFIEVEPERSTTEPTRKVLDVQVYSLEVALQLVLAARPQEAPFADRTGGDLAGDIGK